jgi:anti-sigma factor RsiW
MKEETAKDQEICPRSEIAAYLDGELAPSEELDLEMHFAVCPSCRAELNEQKKLLCALDLALEEEPAEMELPEDFTRVVVTNAESKVKGLRCPRERTRAFLVCAALFVLIVFGLGPETSKIFAALGAIGDQFVAVGGFFVHLVHHVTVAATVILRSLCGQFIFKSVIAAVGLGVFFILSLLLLSRLVLQRHNRFRN